ncbi:MAG: helix-turn-helix domain-containing protein [Lachnospiraceae bacterium]|nr:helix-turn-helix domain-containing protein [Lachnospiraceae bacterium]
MMKYEGYVVGSILRNLRKEKKLTVEEMSGETGISTSSIT